MEHPPFADTVVEPVEVEGRELAIERPPDAEALLDDEAFEQDEFLPYWAELWPSGVALARHLATLPLAGRRVLELGCGLGLPSISAACAGARVLATDWSAEALAFAGRNAARNGVEVETMEARWDDAVGLVARGPFDVVIAADVLYERRNGQELLELLPLVLAGGGEALVADPGRPHARRFLEGATHWHVATLPRPELPRGGIHRLRLRRTRRRPAPTPS